jgi:hypothetical protein
MWSMCWEFSERASQIVRTGSSECEKGKANIEKGKVNIEKGKANIDVVPPR